MSTGRSHIGEKKQIGREYPPAGEITRITRMISDLKEQLRELYPEDESLRQAHPKMHGLVKAKFIVHKDLDENLRVGLFAEPKEYDAFIRFSNSSTKPQADIKPDIRGMAIKIVGVEGEKLLVEEETAKTQDFILISTESFISKNVKEFSRTIRAVTRNSKLAMAMYGLNPFNLGVLLRTVKAFKKIGSLLDTSFYSTTPYQFGDQNRAVKYLCIPKNPRNVAIPKNPDEDYLKYDLIHALKQNEYAFEFSVQFQEDAKAMPIENPTVKWESTPVALATIVIPKQQFDTDEQNDYGTSLSFTPWHSLPAHRPLGGLNRARRLIYEEMAKFRISRNLDRNTEPDNLKIPED